VEATINDLEEVPGESATSMYSQSYNSDNYLKNSQSASNNEHKSEDAGNTNDSLLKNPSTAILKTSNDNLNSEGSISTTEDNRNSGNSVLTTPVSPGPKDFTIPDKLLGSTCSSNSSNNSMSNGNISSITTAATEPYLNIDDGHKTVNHISESDSNVLNSTNRIIETVKTPSKVNDYGGARPRTSPTRDSTSYQSLNNKLEDSKFSVDVTSKIDRTDSDSETSATDVSTTDARGSNSILKSLPVSTLHSVDTDEKVQSVAGGENDRVTTASEAQVTPSETIETTAKPKSSRSKPWDISTLSTSRHLVIDNSDESTISKGNLEEDTM